MQANTKDSLDAARVVVAANNGDHPRSQKPGATSGDGTSAGTVDPLHAASARAERLRRGSDTKQQATTIYSAPDAGETTRWRFTTAMNPSKSRLTSTGSAGAT